MNRSTSSLASQWMPAAAAAIALAAVWPAPAAEPADSWQRYRILVDRNIFLRNRRRPQPRTIRSARWTQPTTTDTDGDLVLTGIARRDGTFVAFFEDLQTGLTIQVPTGRTVGKGKIAAISLNGVEYQRDGAVRSIEIGRRLTGSDLPRRAERSTLGPSTRPLASRGPGDGSPDRPATTTTAAATKPKAASPRAAPGGAKNSDIADILKRMRSRRQQEMRK